MGFAEYGRYDAVGLAGLVRLGEVSPAELLDEALARTARVNPQVNAVIHLMEARARDAIAAGLPDAPLRGVPFLIKDLMTAYAGEPMRCGSRYFKDFVPAADEELTRRYRAAGLVIFGKTNTPELGVSNVTEPELFGPTRNPTGPQAPDVWWGFIGEHAVTRSVRDSAALLDATAGDYPQQLMKLPAAERPFLDETRREPGRLRIALSFDPGLGEALHPENRRALETTAATLGGLGHDVVEVALAVPRDTFIANYAALVAADVAATLRHAATLIGRRARRSDVELATWVLARMGESQSAADAATALWSMQMFSRDWLARLATYDVLLTPTVGMPPLPLGAYRLPARQRQALEVLTALPGAALLSQRRKVIAAFDPVFAAAPYTMIANVTGQPSVSLPLHWTAAGLPMGMLFTAARIGDEATLFRLASQLEQASPWRDRIAPHAIP